MEGLVMIFVAIGGIYLSIQMTACEHKDDVKHEIKQKVCEKACFPHPVTYCTEKEVHCSSDVIKEIK